MTEHDNLAVARYFREGDGRIRDREWGQPGYVLKVWAMRDDGGGLTDVGPEVEAELSRLLVLLNGHAAARAEGAAEAFERAAKVADEWAQSKSCAHHDNNPCCHVRLGITIRDRIRALAEKERGE